MECQSAAGARKMVSTRRPTLLAAEIIPGTICTARMYRQLRRDHANDQTFHGCSGYRPNCRSRSRCSNRSRCGNRGNGTPAAEIMLSDFTGAKDSALIFTMIQMTIENNLDPYCYLTWLLKAANTANLDDPDIIQSLLPWNTPAECRV